MRVLLIHPDPSFSTGLGDTLERFGAVVDYAATGRLGIRMATAHAFDVLVLSAELPGSDGHEVCRRLREEFDVRIPIMMVGQAVGVEPTISALEAGADDYQSQPVVYVEMHARLRALCRRRDSVKVLEIGDLRFDPVSGKVHRQGQPLSLTPTGLKLLQVLMEAAPRVVTYAELEAVVWGGGGCRSTSSLRAQIYYLRNAVDKPFDLKLIRTCHSTGYRMVVPRMRHEPVAGSRRASGELAVAE